MKVAVCISGFVRTYQKCIEDQFANLFHSGHDYHFFIHTWDKMGFTEFWDKPIDNSQDVALDDVINRYAPKAIVVDSVDNPPEIKPAPDLAQSQHVEPSRVMSFFRKVKACNELKNKYAAENNIDYDLVVRMRFDITVSLLLKWESYPKSKLHASDRLWVGSAPNLAMVNDCFGFGGQEVMDAYASTYDNVGSLCSSGTRFHPETLLKANLDLHNVEISRHPFMVNIVR